MVWAPAHVRMVQVQHESPLAHLGSGHEQSPGRDTGFQFDPVQACGSAESEVPGSAPETTRRSGFPIAASQDQSKVGPGMIVQVIRVTLEELVDEHIERKPLAISQEQVLPFQVRFLILTIHDHTVSS